MFTGEKRVEYLTYWLPCQAKVSFRKHYLCGDGGFLGNPVFANVEGGGGAAKLSKNTNYLKIAQIRTLNTYRVS